MNIPILRVDDLLLASIQFDLGDEEADQFQRDLSRLVVEHEAAGVVIDITALEVVDSFIARILNDTARMAWLLGAQVIVCGIRPHVALTLIEMGRDLMGVETALNLDQALARMQRLVAAGRHPGGAPCHDPY